jgi:DNA-binding beta-propeller fold protein YncE
LTYGISQTSQGVAINPITRTAATADANATGSNLPQINLINSLDQSITSITFNATCTFYTTNCAGAPELLGTTGVAWQPYSNALISYNSGQNQVSVSDPVSQRRYALVCKTSGCVTNPLDPNQIALPGTGTATINVANAPGGKLNLFGGIAVDPDTNQAIVVMSGSSSISLINLTAGATATTANTLKPAEITEVVVPNPNPGPGVIGGVPNALVSQGTLTSTTNLAGVQIFGAGFGAAGNANAQVRLDGTPITTVTGGAVTVVSDRQITATIPASFLSFPHRYALDVISNGSQSNATDFIVMQAVDLSNVCSAGKPKPTAVAIADQLANGAFSPVAVVTNNGCTSISVIDINPTVTNGGVTSANPNFGAVRSTTSVGASPMGVAIDQRRGLAVVGNYGDNTASIVDLTQQPPTQKVAAVPVGTNPSGVAINDATDVAIVADTGSNSVSLIDLALLYPPSGTTAPTTLSATSVGVDQQPIAVSIDPDRGTNNQGIAVVTALQLVSGAAPEGALDVVEIGVETPTKSTTISTGTVSATPTGVVFDPTVITGTTNNGVFYANSSGSNVISSFNPDTGGANSVTVGINPTSLGINPQTGAILTTNFLGNSVSIVDTLSSPIKTRQTLGIPGSTQFGVAIDPFTNLAVIVDQANNRVLLFPMPN